MASSIHGFKLNHPGIQSYLDGGHGVSGLVRAEAETLGLAP